jgi:hypothetical protein
MRNSTKKTLILCPTNSSLSLLSGQISLGSDHFHVSTNVTASTSRLCLPTQRYDAPGQLIFHHDLTHTAASFAIIASTHTLHLPQPFLARIPHHLTGDGISIFLICLTSVYSAYSVRRQQTRGFRLYGMCVTRHTASLHTCTSIARSLSDCFIHCRDSESWWWAGRGIE